MTVPPHPARRRPSARRLLTCLALASLCGAASAPAAADGGAIATIVEGRSSVIRALERFDAAEGLRMAPGDLVQTGPEAFLRIDFDDGSAVELAAASLAQIEHPALARAGCGALYLLSGWMKLSAAPRAQRRAALCAPGIAIDDVSQTVVLQADAGAASLYVQDGTARVGDRRSQGAPGLALNAGAYLIVAPDYPLTALERPVPAFLDAVPRPFRDTLPSRYAHFDALPAPPPHGRGPFSYEQAEPWIDAEPALRRQFVTLWHARAAEPAFRAALERELRRHPEWDPVLHPGRAGAAPAAAPN